MLGFGAVMWFDSFDYFDYAQYKYAQGRRCGNDPTTPDGLRRAGRTGFAGMTDPEAGFGAKLNNKELVG